MTRSTGGRLSSRGSSLVAAGVFGCLVVVWSFATSAADSSEETLAKEIVGSTGVQGGIIVHLGCGDGKLTSALRTSERYQVHGLSTSESAVDQARQYIRSLGQYGPVAVDRLSGNRLPYIDNLINLVVSEDLGNVTMDEVMRVLAPRGVAYIHRGGEWTKFVKPVPDEIDEWSHFLHDPSGNAVAHDTVVGPPRHLQWLGSPRWSRHHDRMASMSALVSSGGRLFYIMDEGSRISIQMPPKWTLVARDAFNGTVLWKKPIGQWQDHLFPLKSGPTQLARRLVATGGTVFVTLGIDAPLTALDAATGEHLRTYEGSDGAEELLVHDGKIFLVVNKRGSGLDAYQPKEGRVGDQARVRNELRWNEMPRHVMAYDEASGSLLWSSEHRAAPLTLATSPDGVFLHDGERLICLDRESGEVTWKSEPVGRRPNITFNFGPKLVLHEDVLLFAGGDEKVRGFSTKTGQQLWSAAHGGGGYQSPQDLLVVNGLVWSAPTTRSNDTGIFTGLDPHTGEVKIEFPPNVQTYWFHHRCYIAKATDKYLIPSRTGIEFVDPETQDWDINHWVRGGCLYGVMPSNGMVYAPPHNCACYPEAKLYGFNALAPASGSRKSPKEISDLGRLQRGPAFSQPVESSAAAGNDWPTYRRDNRRSGTSSDTVADDLEKSWQQELGGRLTSVVVTEQKLFVAKIDEHTLYALNADSGKTEWTYTAGGRIDSPPTIDKGRALFGCADGWVYCLRASDGQLIWRFRAAPDDVRLPAFEQLESVWPVHGSVLVEDDAAYFVAGRSNFLDGGLRFIALDVATGRKLAENIIDENDPETGENLQERLQVLQMPVGLPDILSSDGRYIYMRSQQLDRNGRRDNIGPHSGQPAQQGSVQAGELAHLFAPMGYLDGTWFHRSYWVYGRSFAGGHSGYFQAGKYTPSGRILVFDDSKVYGFGRKPQYYRWTTTIEHQLFSADLTAPPEARSGIDSAETRRGARRSAAPAIRVAKSKSLDPTGKPILVSAWVNSEAPDGVILARGGPTQGYALDVKNGKPRFSVRTSRDQVRSVMGPKSIVGSWTHLVGVLTSDRKLELYVGGDLVGTRRAAGFLTVDPVQALEIGADDGGSVGDYKSPSRSWVPSMKSVSITGRSMRTRFCRWSIRVRDQPAPSWFCR